MKLYSLSNTYLRLVLQIVHIEHMKQKVEKYGIAYGIFVVYRSFTSKASARAIRAQSSLNHPTMLLSLSNKA